MYVNEQGEIFFANLPVVVQNNNNVISNNGVNNDHLSKDGSLFFTSTIDSANLQPMHGIFGEPPANEEPRVALVEEGVKIIVGMRILLSKTTPTTQLMATPI